jgi:hypothetical protein
MIVVAEVTARYALFILQQVMMLPSVRSYLTATIVLIRLFVPPQYPRQTFAVFKMGRGCAR